jgi:hypothetical protein
MAGLMVEKGDAGISRQAFFFLHTILLLRNIRVSSITHFNERNIDTHWGSSGGFPPYFAPVILIFHRQPRWPGPDDRNGRSRDGHEP